MKQEIETVYSPGGDNHLLAYYSWDEDFVLNMRVVAIARGIREAKIPGVTDATNCGVSLMVDFDPMRISYEELLKEVKDIEEEFEAPEKWGCDSRLIELPVWFDDPWSMECYLAHKDRHQVKDGSMSNIAYAAKINGFTVKEFIKKICAYQYWAFTTGFVHGAQGLILIGEEKDYFVVPKYEVSKDWTPARAVGLGGIDWALYPYIGAGGYQLFGVTPVEIYRHGDKTLPYFREKDRVFLCNVGDRVIFRPIGKEEYEEIRAKVEEGTYEVKFKEQRWEPQKWLDDPKGYQGTDLS